MNIHVMIDVEANGPCPGLYSMVSIGLALINWSLKPDFLRRTIKFETAPISSEYQQEAYNVIGVTYEQHCSYPGPQVSMEKLVTTLDWWRQQEGAERIVFWSDNPAFDWQFFNYYLWRFTLENKHGHSCRRIGDFWSGFKNNPTDHSTWRDYRKTRHTHDPIDDAVGNAEALEEILRQMCGR